MKKRRSSPWNKGLVVGKKPHLTPDQVATIEYHLDRNGRVRDLAMFRLAIDTLLRGSDLVKLKTVTVVPGGQVAESFTIGQQKIDNRPVQVVLTERTRKALQVWHREGGSSLWNYLFPGEDGKHLTAGQYRRLVKQWVVMAGLNPLLYGSHSLRRTKANAVYLASGGNLRAVQLLLGHSSIQHTQEYLGIEAAEALDIASGVVI